MSRKPYKIISLFSGCGGMDLGFLGGFKVYDQNYRKLPFKIVYANEINAKAALTYETNFKHKPEVGDIAELDVSTLPKADIVIGGFPCQPFSNAGKREGFGDGRGTLYQQMKNVIKYVKPLMFIAENVDGLRTHKADNDNSALDVIVKDFSDTYDVEYKVIKAVDIGLPQTRVRIIIIGRRKDLKGEIIFPQQTHANEPKTKKLKPYRTTYDAIHDLEELLGTETAPSNHGLKDYSKAKFQPGKLHQGNSKEQADKPAHTVRAEAHGNQYAHYNSVGDNPNSLDTTTWRRLTVRECARLQSFPDNFIFPVSQTDAHKQIGNAVPPILAWHVAKNVLKTLQDIEFNLSKNLQ